MNKIDKLTLEEKVGQMFIFGINDNNINGIIDLIKNNKIGGVILYKKNYKTYQEMLEVINKLKLANKDNKIPLFIAIDQEAGRVNRMPNEIKNLYSITKFSKLNDPEIIKKHSQIISSMLIAAGINMNFSPVLDIDNNSQNNVIKNRCFSSKVNIVKEYGTIYMQEMQKNNIIPIVKHFPGHGITKKDSHIFLPYTLNYHEVLNKHILPFEAAIKNGCDGIMVSHIVIRKMTDGLPASLSKKLIKEYIRDRYNYDNLIITDDIRMKPVDLLYKRVSLKKAFSTGADIILFKYRNNDYKVIKKVITMIKNNNISEDNINKSVERILKIKEKYNINDNIVKGSYNLDKLNKEIEKLNNKLNI